MSVDSRLPLPARVVELPAYLRKCFPEITPRTSDDVPRALHRGAQLDLIEWLAHRIEQEAEDQNV